MCVLICGNTVLNIQVRLLIGIPFYVHLGSLHKPSNQPNKFTPPYVRLVSDSGSDRRNLLLLEFILRANVRII